MPAGEITPGGNVIPPRNITNPAPVIGLQGFKWRGTELSPSDNTAVDEGTSDFDETPAAHAQRLLLGEPSAPPELKAVASEDVMKTQLGIDKAQQYREPLLDFPLDVFKGSYGGNGFNLIFRPRPNQIAHLKNGDGPDDNFLQINLTTEQWTFGPTLGKIPNRGSEDQKHINLHGLPYLQTVQDVTNETSGKGDRLPTNKPNGIHLEPGVFLLVPPCNAPDDKPTVVRMASIPHGTTINAQGVAPALTDKQPGKPDFHKKYKVDSRPFDLMTPDKPFTIDTFKSMDANQKNETLRFPPNLDKFNDQKEDSTGRITTAIIQNPNLVLDKANEGLNIIDHVAFTVKTGDDRDPSVPRPLDMTSKEDPKPPLPPKEGTEGIGNIAFLKPNANVEFMKSTFFIETVLYDVRVPGPLAPGETVKEVWATMPQPSLAPTPVFSITAGPKGMPEEWKTIQVPGVQIQYTQTVNLMFATLTWPHVSCATLVPTSPQPFTMK
ncbi:hypothetical protein QBC47DRAFT_352058 [Echria macrotheca]|uniref:Uncharacterized protein n=1 Tax=Echria macrotheca TaxID=438768 RepID=A0AAJ0B5H8_9PEZI|nr:hypothetical protein QBC47DRAFT_352058 [Echria macrotheca]